MFGSPLTTALTTTQPPSYALTATQYQKFDTGWPSSLNNLQLPVYPLTPTVVQPDNLYVLAAQLGMEKMLAGPQYNDDDSAISAEILLDTPSYSPTAGTPYTLTVRMINETNNPQSAFPWFTLQVASPGTGHVAPTRLAGLGDAWLRAHNLMRPDLRLQSAMSDTVTYSQNVDGQPLLGTAVSLRFDGGGHLSELHYRYLPTLPQPILQPALPLIEVIKSAIANGTGFYQGPAPTALTGVPTISDFSLGYTAIRGVGVDYLEPIWELSGTVSTTNGPQPFALYAAALRFVAPSY